MCRTKELKHLVCQHTDSHTKECLAARSSILGRLSKCTPRTKSLALYDLCHECRRYWAEQQVGELEATRSYVSYREAHGHDGPLAPTFVFSADGGAFSVGNGGAAAGESSSAGANPHGLQNVTPLLYKTADPDKRASDASTMTQWPDPSDSESEWVRKSRSRAQGGGDVLEGKGKGKMTETIRDQREPAQAGPKGVLLLSENEGEPPKWI